MNQPAHIAFAALGLIWGSNFIFMKWAVALISPAQVVLLRVLFGFVPILALALHRGALRRADLRHWPHFVVMSVLATAFYYYAFAKGAALLPSSVAGMLSGAIPLFTFATSTLFLKGEPATSRRAAGIAFGFLGVLLVARPWTAGDGHVDPWGAAYMSLGSLSIGASFVYARRFMANLDVSPLALSTYQVGLAWVLLLAVTPLSGASRIAQSAVALIGLVLGLGLIGTGIAYVLYHYVVQRMGAVQASSVTYLPPVVALAIGCLLAGEPLHALDLVAVAAILGGVYAIQSSGAGTPTSTRKEKHSMITRFVETSSSAARSKLPWLLFLAIAFVGSAGVAFAQTTSSSVVDAQGNLRVPENYRSDYEFLGAWAIAAEDGKGSKEMHEVYASPGTIAAYLKAGDFPDGTVLVKEIWGTETATMATGVSSHAGTLKSWFVLVRDSGNTHPGNKLWGDGWGWSSFPPDAPTKANSTDYRADCKGCHVPAHATHWIYVQGYRPLHR